MRKIGTMLEENVRLLNSGRALVPGAANFGLVARGTMVPAGPRRVIHRYSIWKGTTLLFEGDLYPTETFLLGYAAALGIY